MITGTIAICTRDRAALLRRCLASVESSIAEPGQLEVLVVDNGSSDDTARRSRRGLPGGADRRVVPSRASGCRTPATARSPRPRATSCCSPTTTRSSPPVGPHAHLDRLPRSTRRASGGPVGLVWPAGRPPWMTDELTQWYGALDLGDEPVPYPTAHGPYGINMSVRRLAALAVGGYEPPARPRRAPVAVGRGARPALAASRSRLGQCVYVPGAASCTRSLAERADRRWLLRRGWAQGVTNARLEALADRPAGASARAGRRPSSTTPAGAGCAVGPEPATRRSWRRSPASPPTPPPASSCCASPLTAEPRTRPRLTLSVCCLTDDDRPAWWRRCSALFRRVADEIVVAVDSRVDPRRLGPLLAVADTVVRFEYDGTPEQARPWLVAPVPDDTRADDRRRRGAEPRRCSPRCPSWSADARARAVPVGTPLVFPDERTWLAERPWWPDLQRRSCAGAALDFDLRVHGGVRDALPARIVIEPIYHLACVAHARSPSAAARRGHYERGRARASSPSAAAR